MTGDQLTIRRRRARVWELHRQGLTTAQIKERLRLTDRQVTRDVQFMKSLEDKKEA